MENNRRVQSFTNWRPLDQDFEDARYQQIPNLQSYDEASMSFQQTWSESLPSGEAGLQKQSPTYNYIPMDETAGNSPVRARPWRAGLWTRFPLLSFFCLVLVVVMLVGIIIVLLLSDGEDVDSWGAATVSIAGHHHRWQISVSALIALANFIILKALTIMFAEAVAISWWVDALRGQTLRNLHFRWEVGQSIFNILLRGRIWGWICLGSLAFTVFAGLEALLQQASSSTTVLSTLPRNMSAMLASALPVGFSGVVAATGHDRFGIVYFTPPFIQILQNYTSQLPVYLDLGGCDSTSNVSCATRLPGVGFQYTCNATRSSLLTPLSSDPNDTVSQPTNAVFQVSVTGGEDWQIALGVLWQDEKGYDGQTVTNRQCTLVPALVEYPINVTRGIATLQTPTSTVDWATAPQDVDEEALHVDKVLALLPMPDHDKTLDQSLAGLSYPGIHSTLGGLALALSSLFDSSIVLTSDVTNDGADVAVTGSFAAPYAIFSDGTGDIGSALNNTYPSPMNALLSNLRDIMFRSSVAIAEHSVGDYIWTDSSNQDVQTTKVPAQNATGLGQYRIYHTVYRTNRLILSIAIGLMAVAVLAILPLYMGYWRLGRKVSLSPLEVAKALHYSTVIDKRTGARKASSVLDVDSRPDQQPHVGSNFPADELVKLLGSKEVKYGEVAPNTLGVGLIEYTGKARAGGLYS